MISFEVLAQITALIGWLLLIYSYYKEDIQDLLFIQIISSIFYCLNYFFLGAYSGLIVCFIELIKTIGYYKTDKDNLIFLYSLPLYVVIAVFDYNSIYSLLPIIGSIIDGFSLTKNKNIATIGSIISNILWVIYDIIILAYACAITDGILVISNIWLLLFGYSKILKTSKLIIMQSRSFSKNIYNAMYILDKTSYGDEFTWSYDYEKNIKSKNQDSLFIIKYNNEIVGYVSYFVINESEYFKILNSPTFIKEYDLNNVISYQKNKKNYLIIDSINIKNKFRNHVSIDLIINKLKKILIQKESNGYKIESIISASISNFEKEVLEKAGFEKYKDYDKKSSLYLLSNEKIENLYLKKWRERSKYYKYKVYENEKIDDSLIKKIKNLDKLFFKEDYIWNEDYQLKLFNKNKKSMIMVTYDNNLIGYLNYLTITREKYNNMINSNVSVDNFTLDEITNFYKNKKNYITINSVVINKKFQDGYTVKILTKHLKKILKTLHNNKYYIEGINSIAISKHGQKFLEKLGFEKRKELDNNNYLYVLDGNNLNKYLK